jgi:hypothetical protein
VVLPAAGKVVLPGPPGKVVLPAAGKVVFPLRESGLFMKVTVGSFVLCAGLAGGEQPSQLAGGGETEGDVRKYTLATAAKPVDRGNAVTQISFVVEREYASFAAACKATVLHHAAIPRTGAVKFVFEDETGVAVVYLSSGRVARHTWDEIIGCSVRNRYELIGGIWTTSAGEA